MTQEFAPIENIYPNFSLFSLVFLLCFLRDWFKMFRKNILNQKGINCVWSDSNSVANSIDEPVYLFKFTTRAIFNEIYVWYLLDRYLLFKQLELSIFYIFLFLKLKKK